MKRLILCVLIAASGLAEQPQAAKKAACNAAARGKFWPEEANADPRTARKLSQCGSLEVCTVSSWRYKWRPVAVNVHQLGKGPHAPSAECAALVAESTNRASSSPARGD